MCLSFANSSLVRIGDFSSIKWQLSRFGLEQIAFGANRRFGGGDDFFADTIDRRIGDLREKLFEIVEQRLRLVRQNRQRRIRAHRANGFHAVARHRHHEHRKSSKV